MMNAPLPEPECPHTAVSAQVDYPQWYPFEGVYGYGNGGEDDPTLGRHASFRFRCGGRCVLFGGRFD
jgi:hypothetical protein